LWVIPTLALSVCIACLMGYVVFAYYTAIGCDPLANHDVNTRNEVNCTNLLTI